MSRVGQKEILIPENVNVFLEMDKIFIAGIYGNLSKKYLPFIKIEKKNNFIYITRIIDTKISRSYHGFIRMYIKNMIIGVTNNYSKTLILEGIGFKFTQENNLLILNIGFTHTHKILIPDSLEINLHSPIKITISGPDKEEVTLFSDVIQKIRPPEPYKGKGILYEGQQILKKIGKRRR